MATTQELEELVVKMTGKAEPYLNMLDKAFNKTTTAGSGISSVMDQTTTKVTTGLENLAKKTDSTAANFGKIGKSLKDIGESAAKLGDSISKLMGDLTLESALAEFREAERSTALLTASLEANGRKVTETLETYKAFAEQIQDTTTFSGDQVIEMFRLAESYEVTGEAAKRAVKNALALSEAHGIEAESAIRATAALEQGSTRALSKYIPILRTLEDDTSKVAEAQRILGRMYGQVEASVNTSGGTVKRLTNEWNNFKQSVGEIIQKILNPLTAILQKVVDGFRALPEPVKQVIALVMTLTVVLGTLATVIGTGIVAWGALSGAVGVYITKAAIATAASLALKFALVAGVALAAYELGKALSGASEDYEKFNEVTTKAKKLNEEWADKFKTNTDRIVESINRISDIGEKKSRLGEELSNAQNELRGYQSGLRMAQKEVEELDSRWKRWTGNKVLEVAEHNVDDYKTKLELAKSRVEQLSGTLEKLRTPKSDTKLTDDIAKFVETLKTQANTFGMTSEQVDIYKFSLRGASGEVLDLAKRQMALNEQLKGFNDITTKSRDLSKKLSEELSTIGMEPVDASIKLMSDALDELMKKREQLTNKVVTLDIKSPEFNQLTEELKKVTDQSIKALEELTKLKVIQGKISEEKSFQDARKRGIEITKQVMTAQETYKATVSELNKLLNSNLITQNTFNRATEDAKEKLDKATGASNKYKESLQLLNAVQFSSAEAISRVQQMREDMRGQFLDVRAKADMSINKDDEETAKKIDETNEILRRIEDKPAPILGIVNINP